jgi:hypothetical protein
MRWSRAHAKLMVRTTHASRHLPQRVPEDCQRLLTDVANAEVT